MAFHEQRFPLRLSLTTSGGPGRQTDIVSLSSGREARNRRWRFSRRRFDVGTAVRSVADLYAVLEFFEARGGQLHAFRFRDPVDSSSARPGEAVTPVTLLSRRLDPAIRLGTSMPRADPAGDYAFALFARAEAVLAGARAALEAKALTLTGGPDSARPPAGRDLYAWQFERDAADLFLTYCTNAVLALRADPRLQRIEVPDALAVFADYGMLLLEPRAEAARLALFILSPQGQMILARHGFDAPGLPKER